MVDILFGLIEQDCKVVVAQIVLSFEVLHSLLGEVKTGGGIELVMELSDTVLLCVGDDFETFSSYEQVIFFLLMLLLSDLVDTTQEEFNLMLSLS